MSGGADFRAGQAEETPGRDVLRFYMGLGRLLGGGGVVGTGEAAPPSVRLPHQLGLDGGLDLRQAARDMD